MRFWQIVLLEVLLCLVTCLAMRKQGVAVRGQLLCGLRAANNTKVRIVDIDYGLDPDDTLDEKRVDESGRFELSGTTHELTPIDPVLYIWHECRDEKTPCSRKIKLVIPKKFIHNGNPTAEQWIDLGTFNLEGAFDDEGRECIN
ncbi:hypothetical protein Angca_009621 [Angiostrongylus cantonensis]|nr:hypothetical protein Angca_009621 [Angiostrongylus cantonensis]